MKGQITFIVIIGMLILIAIAALTYVFTSLKNFGGNAKSNNAQSLSLESCAQTQLGNIVLDLSGHGGLLQNNIYTPFSGNNFDKYGKVAYWLRQRIPISGGENTYQGYNFNYYSAPAILKGKTVIPRLYTDSEYTAPAIQKTISDELLSNISAKCHSYFDSVKSPLSISISSNTVEADLRVKLSGSSSFTTVPVKINAPLKQAYNFAKYQTIAEAGEIFDKNPCNNDFCHNFADFRTAGFTTSYINGNKNNRDSLVVLTSDSVKINGEPYKFIYAIQDRPPLIVANTTGHTISNCNDFVIADPDAGDSSHITSPQCTPGHTHTSTLDISFKYYGTQYNALIQTG